jgi:hypothetical protein
MNDKVVYTYDNPFALDKMSYWSNIKKYPHLCVSQTLVEGLKNRFGRESFTYISTVDAVLKELYKPWTNQTKNNVEQFIIVSEMIREIKDEKLRNSMFFNRQDVFESLRYLFEIQFEDEQIIMNELTDEQQVLVSFYNRLKKDDRWTILSELILETYKDDLVVTYMNYLIQEIKHDLFEDEKMNVEWDELEDKINSFDISKFKLKARNKKKNLKDFYIELIREMEVNKSMYDKVVIHGVHQFTPMILQLVKQLEEMGIEVIFLINYVSKYPKIFETWKNVYKWFTPQLNYKNEVTSIEERDLGKAIGDLLHSNDIELQHQKYKVIKFDNLSSASAHIGETFVSAGEELAQMGEQFYAVSNIELNEVLKGYFPNHFREKQFLSYPVGQFVLGLYHMWDFKDQEIILKEHALKECLTVDFLGGNNSLSWIYEQIKDYISKENKLSKVVLQLETLKNDIKKIDVDKNLIDLKSFSFFNLSIDEITQFVNFLLELNMLAKEIFSGSDTGYVNYGEHFKKLIDLIEMKVENNKYISDAELELINTLKERFDDIDQLNINGNIDDLKETIHFYLQASKNDQNQAKWICRNFEQLDGGVLLNNQNRIHLMMVSNEKMNIRANDLFTWPLNEDFFTSNHNQTNQFAAINLISKNEYKYFLRYSLFYATYYLRNEIIISYIENSDEDEKDTLYFILELLGFNAELYIDRRLGLPIRLEGNLTEKTNFDPKYEDYQEFSVCGYRFLQNRIINSSVVYQNSFHFYHYYRRLLYYRTIKRLVNKNFTDEIVTESLKLENEELKSFFPFQTEAFFFDVFQAVLREIKSNYKGQIDEQYHDIRKKFLMASVTDEDNKNLLYDLHVLKNRNSMELKKKLEKNISLYIENGIPLDRKVNPAVCQYCNIRDLCLNYFSMGESNE